MDEPWEQAKWKEPGTKGYILYGSIYMKYPEYTNPKRQEAD